MLDDVKCVGPKVLEKILESSRFVGKAGRLYLSLASGSSGSLLGCRTTSQRFLILRHVDGSWASRLRVGSADFPCVPMRQRWQWDTNSWHCFDQNSIKIPQQVPKIYHVSFQKSKQKRTARSKGLAYSDTLCVFWQMDFSTEHRPRDVKQTSQDSKTHPIGTVIFHGS